MSRWLRGFASGKVISKKSMDYILADNSKLGYSCGWVVSQEGIMRHSGNLGGYKTFAMIDYENDICVVVLSNKLNSFMKKDILRAGAGIAVSIAHDGEYATAIATIFRNCPHS